MTCSCNGGCLFIGATPTHHYTFPAAYYELEKICITYAQDGQIVLEKTKDDLEFLDSYTINNVNYYPSILKLSQEDTYKFDGRKRKYCMQVKAKTYSGEVIESPIRYYNVEGALNKEVL